MRNPFKAGQQLTQIEAVLERSQRGIGKRIDENRELLELLYLDAPVLMKENPWIAGWLHSQEEFLNDLAKAAGVELGGKVRAYPSPSGATNEQEGEKHARRPSAKQIQGVHAEHQKLMQGISHEQ
jgi:hypothetical protein